MPLELGGHAIKNRTIQVESDGSSEPGDLLELDVDNKATTVESDFGELLGVHAHGHPDPDDGDLIGVVVFGVTVADDEHVDEYDDAQDLGDEYAGRTAPADATFVLVR